MENVKVDIKYCIYTFFFTRVYISDLFAFIKDNYVGKRSSCEAAAKHLVLYLI